MGSGWHFQYRGMLAWRSMLAGFGLSTMTAVMLHLAFPPYGIWPLIWVGLVPAVVAQHRVLPKSFAGAGISLAVSGFFWAQFRGMFTRLFTTCVVLIIALVALLAGTRERAFHERTHYRWLVPWGATMWVGVEMIRGLIPTVGTWAFLPYALYSQPWLLQPISIFGIHGLSLLVVATNYVVAQVIISLFDLSMSFGLSTGCRPLPVKRALRWMAGMSTALLLWVGLSAAIMEAPAATVRVAAIHPAFRIQTQEGIERLFSLTREAARRGARLIVWNEGALPFDPRERYTARLRDLSVETGADLVIGYAVRTDRGLRNEVTVLSSEGQFLGLYGKDHPVVWAGEASITRGTYPVFRSQIGTIGAIICYDLDFTDTARKVVRNGARLLAVPSSDWPGIAHKHYTHLVFRAIENRVSVVKADVGFDSAIIDPYGWILQRRITPEPKTHVLVADVPLGGGRTPLHILGDWSGWLALGGLASFVFSDMGFFIRRKP